jgi:hypothetical protein
MPSITRHQGKRFFVNRLFGEKGSLIILGIAVPLTEKIQQQKCHNYFLDNFPT